MQAPSQEMVNMRQETPMDVTEKASAAAVQEALEIPLQLEMDGHHMPALCYIDQDAIANCNFTEGVHCAENAAGEARDASATKIEKLIPCCANFCSISSCYCEFPGCIGCTGDCTLLCLQQKQTCCKPLDCKDQDKRCCAIVEQQRYCVIPRKILECKNQCFCTDNRAAIPCTQEVPCMLTLGFLTLCADFGCKVGCCQNVGQLIPRLNPEE